MANKFFSCKIHKNFRKYPRCMQLILDSLTSHGIQILYSKSSRDVDELNAEI